MTFQSVLGPDWRSTEFVRAAQNLSMEQRKRVAKLRLDHFYLMNVTLSPGSTMYSFTISGSTRNIYEVVLHDTNRFSCTCPDASTHCRRHGVVCKHVVFVLFRVLKVVDFAFFATRCLSSSATHWAWTRSGAISILHGAASDRFKQQVADETLHTFDFTVPDRGEGGDPEDDDCPICYDSLHTTLVRCPECKKVMHASCVAKWLSTVSNKTCVYCRSTMWRLF